METILNLHWEIRSESMPWNETDQDDWIYRWYQKSRAYPPATGFLTNFMFIFS